MKKANIQQCADAGSNYCPCHLAYSGDCIECGLLNSKNKCECIWQGVCIYSEVQHNKNMPINERKEYLCKIEEVRELDNNIFLIKVQIPKTIAKDLSNPGAYILMKSKDRSSDMFNTPISVMDVDVENGILEVVLKPRGIKTKTMINFDEVFIKAPYYNGIFGIKDIKTTMESNCVVILNGLSQVNSINIVKRLKSNNNKVDVFINNKGVILEDIVKKLSNLDANIYYVDIKEERDLIIDYIKRNDVSFVYSGGSNSFNKEIMELVDTVDNNIKLAISNNNLICCGEGICGACTINLNGERVKTCKSQVNSRDYLNTL